MKYLVLTLMICISATSAAGVDHVTDQERLALEKVLVYLKDAQGLVAKANSVSAIDTRFPLNYPALSTDMSEIRDALERHLKAPSRSPRKVKHLQSDYVARESTQGHSDQENIIGVFVE
ncbi:RAQPRD family integrative conjugative element protein [Gilvimarinus polysaccharolyticus]|uniref:RAQPRD family integrative conjugative element protein n=1 Tax=Gilvimarinus polysaccharolyticus TaxID=863921 RepID=UPI0006738130|nr:RAQPRD family integrative conjugative element protein [Gilvimarinus polysaccharolyticus]